MAEAETEGTAVVKAKGIVLEDLGNTVVMAVGPAAAPAGVVHLVGPEESQTSVVFGKDSRSSIKFAKPPITS